jgi:hypothetical protein
VSTFPGREMTFPKFTIMVISSHDFPCFFCPDQQGRRWEVNVLKLRSLQPSTTAYLCTQT